ncbi:MAG: ribosome small subunit-dependent GTPase A [Alphaproteobacteria bacterium]
MQQDSQALAGFGWGPFFQAQLGVAELDRTLAVRVMAVHRGALDVEAPGLAARVAAPRADREDDRPTVGDWLLLDRASGRPLRLLGRRSLFRRRAAGTGRAFQLIAANVDTLFVVSSCNRDFNVARLERYLALARQAEVTPVVVLTKADTADDVDGYRSRATALLPGLVVEAVDARAPEATACLAPWCGDGQTVALLGSSGVGKSTLVNSLSGRAGQATAGIRADDDKGRHTTRSRSLHRLPSGGWLVDTPGMRELQLADVETGLDAVFADVAELAATCRFADCRHQSEPGCAVRAAIADGRLDAERLRRHAKLAAEEAHNRRSLAERHALERGFGRRARNAMREKRNRQGG